MTEYYNELIASGFHSIEGRIYIFCLLLNSHTMAKCCVTIANEKHCVVVVYDCLYISGCDKKLDLIIAKHFDNFFYWYCLSY